MSYTKLQTIFAKYGFITTPISKEEFSALKAAGYSQEEQLYSIGCDLAAGYSLLEILKQHEII